MGDFWQRNIMDPGKLPALLALAAFIATFLITRIITRMIRAGRGPFKDNVTAGGTHVHHSVPGLMLLVTGAFMAISVSTAPWNEISAIAIGVGTSLVLDEFALILHLEDVYWATEGRISVELVGLAAACLGFVTVGLVPFGIEDVNFDEFGLRVTLTSSFILNGVLVLLCVLKGKYRFALVGTFMPFTAWAPALRLARPRSWWARRWYRGKRMDKAVAREQRFQRKWDPRWERLSNLVAGRPTALPPITTQIPALLANPVAFDHPAATAAAAGPVHHGNEPADTTEAAERGHKAH